MMGPKTIKGSVFEIKCGKSPCNKGAVTMPIKPSTLLGYNPYHAKLTCSTISNSFTPQSMITNKDGYKKLKNNLEVVFRICSKYIGFYEVNVYTKVKKRQKDRVCF